MSLFKQSIFQSSIFKGLWKSNVLNGYIQKIIDNYGDDLVLYYPLDEAVGNVCKDVSVNESNTIYDSVLLNAIRHSSGTPAPFFDGINSFVKIPVGVFDNLFNKDDGTFLVWIKFNDADDWENAGGTQVICKPRIGGADQFHMQIQNGGDIRWRRESQNVSITNTETPPIIDTEWHCLVGTYSVLADELKLFFDGVQLGITQTGLLTMVNTGFDPNRNNIGVDNSASLTNPTMANIGHYAILDRPLTPSEVLDISTIPDGFNVGFDDGFN